MLITPDDFEADRLLELRDDTITHVFVRDALVLPEAQPQPLPWGLLRAAGFVPDRIHGIGRIDGEEHVAVSLHEAHALELPDGFIARGLRQWFGVMDDRMLGVALRAVQVVEWDRTHRFCGACGQPTEQLVHERARKCSGCRLTVYPRISPAMMVLIRRENQLLLGRGLSFPPGRYSALAGFVEAGETIEQAIHREVLEEVNVQVNNLRYFASQSWPFPNSLMIAYKADYVGGELRHDPAELADAQFFDLDALPQMPPRLSIARALIDSMISEMTGAG